MPTLREGVLDLQGFKPIPWLLNLPDLGNNHELGVLLAHGAGGDASSGNLPAFAGACTEAGAPCLRFTARGGSLPHRIKVAKALLAAAPSLPGLQHVQRWVLAGHSMGARVAASLAGEQPPAVPVAGALLLSYPLHPPAKPGELRDGLLHQLAVPTLLVRGSRDGFSTQDKWDAALAGMDPACAWQQHTVEGGDHGLKIAGKDSAALSAAGLASACAAVQQFVRQAAQGGQGVATQEQQPQQQQEGQQRQGVAASGKGRRQRAAAETTATAAQAQAPPARATKHRRAARAKESASTSKPAGKRQRQA